MNLHVVAFALRFLVMLVYGADYQRVVIAVSLCIYSKLFGEKLIVFHSQVEFW